MTDLISRQAAIEALSGGSGCGNVCRRSIERIPSVDEQKIAVEYCKKRNLVMITAESFEVLKAYYNRINGGRRK